MVSNEFDIEKAKAGEPVEFRGHTGWELCKFQGISESGDGYFIVERINKGGFQLSYANDTDLRMAPKTVKVRYRNYKMGDSVSPAVSMICDRPGWHTPGEIEKKHGVQGMDSRRMARSRDGAMNSLPVIPDRQTFIGGSDVAAILGVSRWKSPFQLYQEKIGAFVEVSNPARDKVLGRGKRWEPVVIEMLIDELQSRGHEVEIIARNARYQDPEHSFLAAEIDLELLLDGVEVNGEIKTVHPFAAKDWGEEGTDEIPVYYTAQVMHGLMIKPRPLAIVAALIGADDLRVHQVARDDDLIAAIRAKSIEFWQRVQDRNPPDPTEPEDVKWLYAKDIGTVTEADDALALICQELKDKKTLAKNLENDIVSLETVLKAKMGGAAILIYRNAPLATWKTQSASRIDIKALETEHPQIAEEFRKTEEFRVLRLKKRRAK